MNQKIQYTVQNTEIKKKKINGYTWIPSFKKKSSVIHFME